MGPDSLNLYLILVLPDPIQHWFYFLTKRVMSLDIPQTWLGAEIFLLPKGGDRTSRSHYKPIALPTSIYKIIATHTSNYLNSHTAKLGTLSDSQFRLRKKIKPQTIRSLWQLNAPSTPPLMFYTRIWLKLNYVVFSALFKLLEKAGFPPAFIALVKRLYRSPLATPRVIRHRLASHLQLQGLRKGCPLSPSLFSLDGKPPFHTGKKSCKRFLNAHLRGMVGESP